jgi:putative flippase GtrA|tara:strand:- start:102 stop:485 length:384 start_codon:yes stop_codon:yes gene_type:complete
MLKKFLSFCAVGVGATLIDWGFFNLFYFLGIWFEVAITLSFLISIIFNFSMNRAFTFSARGHSITKQATRWIVLYAFTLLVRIGLGRAVLTVLGESVLNANIALVAGFAIAIPLGFLGSMFWVFKKS